MKTEYHLTGRVGAERGNIRTVTVEPNLDSCTLFESGDGIETALSFYLTRVFRDVLSGNEGGFEDVFESFPELRNCYLPSNEEIAIKIENGFIRLKTKLKYRTDIIADPEMPITLDFRIIANKSLQEGGREAEQYGEVRASSFTVNLPWYLRIDIFNIRKQILVALLHDAFTDGMKILASLLADVIIGYFRFYAAVPNGLRFHHAICIKEADNDGLLNIHFCPNYISAFNPNISVLNANKKD